ncbi:MAG: hypothetical protein F6K57_35960 [Moorea sp. SIO4A5]|nr:hypothetical protein [Moorena sp. SIO4A5]
MRYAHAKRTAVSRQPSAFWHRLWPKATLCERRCDITQHYSNADLFYSKAPQVAPQVAH